MSKRKLTRKEASEKKFMKKVPPLIPSGDWVDINPFFKDRMFSPLNVMFPGDEPRSFYGMPAESYLDGTDYKDDPWPLINAVNKENELVLRINLNSKRNLIVEHFKKLLTTAFKELKKHGRGKSKIYDREFDLYLQIYKLREKDPREWTFEKIAEKMFPRYFNVANEEAAKVRSAIETTRRYYHEAERLLKANKPK